MVGGTIPYTIAAGTYSSNTSQTHANSLASAAVSSGGQAYANANAACGTSCASCGRPNTRCVNGLCEFGFKVYTASLYNNITGTYTCVFHYEWSDGHWSQDYYEEGMPAPCN